MHRLPENAKSYKRTDIFDGNTIPKGLLSSHTTKEGTWGKIKVVEGQVKYIIESNPNEEFILSPDQPGVVKPQEKHHLELIGAVKFFVEFYRVP